MGLCTTHGCWNGSYGSFNTFRHKLAEYIGINLDDYYGYQSSFDRNKPVPYKDLETINHGIGPLLNHSDCDGELTPQECQEILDGLQQIVDDPTNGVALKDNYEYPWQTHNATPDTWMSMKIHDFMDGCREAIRLNENVEFH